MNVQLALSPSYASFSSLIIVCKLETAGHQMTNALNMLMLIFLFFITMCKMNRKLSTQQRVFLLEKWWYHHKNSALVLNDFEQEFPGVVPPRRETIYHLCNRFRATGSVNDLPRSGRPRCSRTVENVDLVAQSVVASPRVSTRKRSLRLGVSRTSLQRI